MPIFLELIQTTERSCSAVISEFSDFSHEGGTEGGEGGQGGVVTLRGRTGSETVVNAVRTRVMRRNQSGEPVT